MIKYSLIFLTGVFVGQEYRSIPNVRVKVYEIYEELRKSDFYKKLRDDFNDPKKK